MGLLSGLLRKKEEKVEPSGGRSLKNKGYFMRRETGSLSSAAMRTKTRREYSPDPIKSSSRSSLVERLSASRDKLKKAKNSEGAKLLGGVLKDVRGHYAKKDFSSMYSMTASGSQKHKEKYSKTKKSGAGAKYIVRGGVAYRVAGSGSKKAKRKEKTKSVYDSYKSYNLEV